MWSRRRLSRQRIAGNEPLELRDGGTVAAIVDLGSEAQLDGAVVQFVEASDLSLGKLLVCKVPEGRASP